MVAESMRFNSIVLAVFALITALILSGTDLLTRDRIAASERAAAQKALLEVVPADRHDNDLLTDVLPVPAAYWPLLGLKAGGEIHIARKQGQPVAAIIPAVTRHGYSGDIGLIVGINRDGSISGVRVTAHRETPGLGDKIDLAKSDWILAFDGRSLGRPTEEKWAVKKDGGAFDQFTGATITPRAVVNLVHDVLTYYRKDGQRLFDDAVKQLQAAAPSGK